MRVISAVRRIAAVPLLTLLALAPAATEAGVLQCGRAITDGFVKFARARAKALQRCEENTVQDKQPPGTVCPLDSEVVASLVVARAGLAADIRDKCGGRNRTCNAGDTGDDADVPLASVGWDLGACPDFEGTGCTNPIGDCADIAECLGCIGAAAAGQAVALPYGSLVLPTRDTAPELNKCQKMLGRAAVKFLRKKSVALEMCEDRVRRGASTGPCPDARAAEKIAAAEQGKIKKICAQCGGADRLCGGGDDFTPSAIGFPAACPSVTVPGGASCAGAVTTLDELVACVDCVMEFKADCLDAISALDLGTYPAECVAPPGP